MNHINLERMFDMVVHMNENSHEDYVFDKKKGVTLNYKQQGIVLKKSIQSFMQSVAVKEGADKFIQAFSGSSDLPVLTKDVFNVTTNIPEFDTFWQKVYKGVPLKKGQLSWEIANVTSGLTFELIPEGGKAKFYGISGVKTDAKINKYGAGIGLTWELIEGRKLYQFIELMEDTRAKLNDLWANIHYGLIATAAAINVVAWQGAATDPTLERDIATINLGYQTIGAACKDKGYGDMANSQMIIFCPPSLKSRIMQSIRATSADIIRGRVAGATGSKAGQVIEYNVTPYFSWNSNLPANKGVMILPGRKIQNSVYLRELGLSEKDIETLSELRTYWTAFGAIVADTDQTAELAFA